MSTYSIKTFQPNVMTIVKMRELAAMVWEPFNWYAPGSGEKDIFDLLLGNGNSFVDVVFRDQLPCGFLASEAHVIDSCIVCYHIGVSILEQDRRKGLYRQLTQLSIGRAKFNYIVARTQNPAIYESLQRHAKNNRIYPQPGLTPPPQVRVIAQALCHGKALEAESLIVRNAHHFVRAEREYMMAKNEQINLFFKQSLKKDDGFMVVVAIT